MCALLGEFTCVIYSVLILNHFWLWLAKQGSIVGQGKGALCNGALDQRGLLIPSLTICLTFSLGCLKTLSLCQFYKFCSAENGTGYNSWGTRKPWAAQPALNMHSELHSLLQLKMLEPVLQICSSLNLLIVENFRCNSNSGYCKV